MAKRIRNVYERKGHFYLDYIHPLTKERIRKSANTTIKDKAIELYNKEFSAAYDQTFLGKETNKTVRELVDWCWDNHWQFDDRGADKKTRYVYMKAPLDKFGDVKASTITADMLRAFMAERLQTVKKRSVELEFSSLKFAYNRGIENGLLTENPFKKLGKRIFWEEDGTRSRIGTPKEIELLLGSCAGMLHKIIEFDLNCGLRKGQIENLKRSDVDLINLTMTVGCGKGGRYRTYKVPIFERALEIIKSLPLDTEYLFTNERGNKIPTNGLIHSGFARLVKRCGIADFKFHDLRHTFATDYYRKEKDLVGIQEILGHKDVKTTKVYLNLTDADLRPARGYRFGSMWHKNDTTTFEANEKTVEIVENQSFGV